MNDVSMPRRAAARAVRRLTVPLAVMAMALVLGAGVAGERPTGASAAAATVSVFPIPGARVAAPQTQITFRGLPAGALGQITVTGSVSGVHSGHVAGDSDGNGGSFLPDAPFTPGETVTVATGLNIVGASGGRFSFQVAQPAGPLPILHWPAAGRSRGDVQFFHSRHDLSPVSVTVTKQGAGGDGDIFVAPQWGPVQDGPMILDPRGNLVWFDRLAGSTSAANFQVQRYQGQPVLTWWQGTMAAGVGIGQDVIFNNRYQEIATVNAGNGLHADLHDFQITPRGTALILADYPVIWDSSVIKHGSTKQIVLDSVVQEIDIKTGLVLFQWDALDHVPLTDTYQSLPGSLGEPFDAYHLNSVDLDTDGNLVVGSRETWAAYKIDHQTGAIMWTLGGKRSSFKLSKNTYWAYQHDAEPHAGDRYVTIFDDEAGPPTIRNQSRAIKVSLDFKHMSATSTVAEQHSPGLLSNYEGNLQELRDGDFVGWGQQPYFTQFDKKGRMAFDAHMNSSTASYRAYRFSWNATPWNAPALAASTSRGHSYVFMSWNGATNVVGWRVYAGSSPRALRYVMSVSKRGFEARAVIPAARYVEVQAMDAKHHVIRASSVVAPH